MNITDVKVFLAREDKLRAYITVVFDDCFVVRDLKVIQGEDSLFVAMPSKKTKEGSFRDIVHPINQETRQKIEAIVLDAYNQAIHSVSLGNSKASGT
jgi:stage V sporulation protein G